MICLMKIEPVVKRHKRTYHYSCQRCFYTVDDDETKMITHCLKVHGITGKFKKGYKVVIRHKG